MDETPAFELPAELYYDGARHLWVRGPDVEGQVERPSRVRVGIDSIGLESLGELAYVSLHEVGTHFEHGAALGSLEAAKMTSALVAPVAGRMVARNDAVLRDPLLVNRDPYGDGWLFELEADDWERDSAELISERAIDAWAESERARFGDQASRT